MSDKNSIWSESIKWNPPGKTVLGIACSHQQSGVLRVTKRSFAGSVRFETHLYIQSTGTQTRYKVTTMVIMIRMSYRTVNDACGLNHRTHHLVLALNIPSVEPSSSFPWLWDFDFNSSWAVVCQWLDKMRVYFSDSYPEHYRATPISKSQLL